MPARLESFKPYSFRWRYMTLSSQSYSKVPIQFSTTMIITLDVGEVAGGIGSVPPTVPLDGVVGVDVVCA
jgi:hypothetical protein